MQSEYRTKQVYPRRNIRTERTGCAGVMRLAEQSRVNGWLRQVGGLF